VSTPAVDSRRWRSLALNYSALRLSGQALEFLGFLLLARGLDPATFGRLAIAFLICRYGGIIGDWGALSRGSRDVAAAGRHGSVAALVHRRQSVTLPLAVAVTMTAVASGNATLVPVVGVTLGIGLSRDWIALGTERGIRAGVPSALQGGLIALGGAVAATELAGAVAVGGAYAAAMATSLVLNRRPGATEIEVARAPDAWLLIGFLAIQLTSTADTVLLGFLRGPTDAGTYAAIYRIPNAWLALMSALIAGALPLATKAVGEERGDALRRRSLRASSRLAALVLLGAPLAYLIVPVLYGPAYADGQAAAAVLGLSTAVVTYGVPLHVFAVASGHDRRYALTMAAGAAANLAMNAVLIPTAGMVGAATATALAQVLITALLFRLLRR
jgi:O-antigen/teichoic acid export membrane protein